MMKKQDISLEFVRRIILHEQMLVDEKPSLTGKERIAQIIDKLGYIQIDPMVVIERTQHHVLWTRDHEYHPNVLYELQVKDRKIFEYWGHALAFMPMKDYRFCLPRMRNFANPQNQWALGRLERSQHLLQPIMDQIRQHGPMSAKDFAQVTATKDDATTVSFAFDLLFWKGDLMVAERQNLQKIYDITERVLPEWVAINYPDDNELGQFFVRRALTAYGVAQESEICNFMQPESSRDTHVQAITKDKVRLSLQELINTNEVIPIYIEGNDQTTYYALKDILKKSGSISAIPPQVFLLSPFDNLIIQRDRIRRIFGFDYALECYLPASKRTYGYYVLPILWSDALVGRLDPKADRKTNTMIINSLAFEPGFDDFDQFIPYFVRKLIDFSRFNQCKQIRLERVTPEKIKMILKQKLSESNIY